MEDKSLAVAVFTGFFAAGICAEFLGLKILFAIFISFIIILFVLFKKFSPFFAVILCIAFYTGIADAHINHKMSDALSEIGFANNVSLKGRVFSIPKISKNETGAKFFLNVYDVNIKNKTLKTNSVKTLVSINGTKSDFQKIKIGDVIKITGKLRKPPNATNPSQFDYSRFLKHKKVFSVLYCEGNSFEIISKPDVVSADNKIKELWWFILGHLDALRAGIMSEHEKYIKSPNLEVLGGIVFGDDAINPPDEIKQSFINSGLLHLLAASGLNVALIFALFWALGNFLNIPYKTNIISGMFIIILYTFMTGFPPSILRASIMLLFILAGKLFFRKASNIALIFFTGFILSLFNPHILFDVGFQLSFLVTLGLIFCIDPVASKFKKADIKYKKYFKKSPLLYKKLLYNFSPVALFSLVAVPLVAQLFASPLQMYYFNTFAPYSILANITVVPFIGIVSFSGFLGSLLSLIPLIKTPLLFLLDSFLNPVITIILNISNYFSALDNSMIKTPSPSHFQIIIFTVSILILTRCIYHNFKRKSTNIAMLLCIILFSASFINFSKSSFEIIAFDVGNADNFLIKSPKGKYIMIDTGRLPYKGLSSAKTITLEYLYDKNIKEIDTLIVTHFDSDHSGGTIDVLENIKVNNLILNNTDYDSKNSYSILKYIKDNNIPYKIAKNKETVIKENDFKITTYKASLTGEKINKQKLENEKSTITLVEYKKIKALFMADAGIHAYNELKDCFIKVDILKVGHHGAKNTVNKQMLDKLNPKYSIISTGFNMYGHPDVQTVEALYDRGIKILSTKYEGAVKFTSKNGEDIEVYTFLNRKNTNILNIENLKINDGFKKIHFDETKEDKSVMFNKFKKRLLSSNLGKACI